MNIIIISAIPY